LKQLDHNIGFREKRQFFAENWEKSQKIVIIISTPGRRHELQKTKTQIFALKVFGNPFFSLKKRKFLSPCFGTFFPKNHATTFNLLALCS
jgi:phosphotransferase system IIA component